MKWSDGSMQLLIGNEVLDISVQDAKHDQSHLFLRHGKVVLFFIFKILTILSDTKDLFTTSLFSSIIYFNSFEIFFEFFVIVSHLSFCNIHTGYPPITGKNIEEDEVYAIIIDIKFSSSVNCPC